MTVRLTEDGNNLLHLEAELTVFVGQRRAMTLRFVLLPVIPEGKA